MVVGYILSTRLKERASQNTRSVLRFRPGGRPLVHRISVAASRTKHGIRSEQENTRTMQLWSYTYVSKVICAVAQDPTPSRGTRLAAH